MADTHFHIPRGFEGVITIQKDGTVIIKSSVPAKESAVTAGVEGADVLEDLLQRHEKYDPKTMSRIVAEVLVKGGWQVYPHQRYIRFVYPGKKHELTAYLSSKDLTFTRLGESKSFLMSLPGAEPGNEGEVRFLVDQSSFNQTLLSLADIEQHANGE